MSNLADEVGKVLAKGGPQIGGNVLRSLLDAAVDGVGKLPGAKAASAKNLVKAGDSDAAIEALMTTHVSLATAQGFITNIGGLPAAVVGLPANIAAVAFVQLRLVAMIAHLRGYDVDAPGVRTAIALCLLGEDGVAKLVEKEELPSVPLAIATAPMFDSTLANQVTEQVFGEITSRLGGRHAAFMMARRIPLLGGGVSGAMDAWSTRDIGLYAKKQFVRRRRLTS